MHELELEGRKEMRGDERLRLYEVVFSIIDTAL
jgi:hypothetical protein